ncbi:hypothetical protein, partial [Modestobacter versicolor]
MTSPDWEATSPYAGPPQYAPEQYPTQPYVPQQYAPPQYAPPPYGQPPQPQWAPPPYGYPQPGWPPRAPQRPGSLIAAAVVGFVSAVLVLIGTLYAAAFGALVSLARGPDEGMSGWFALLQVALAALLVVGGVRALAGDPRWLWGAAVLQLALCGYWFLVLGDIASSVFQDTVRVLPLLYVALALLAGGLTLLPDARRRPARPAP